MSHRDPTREALEPGDPAEPAPSDLGDGAASDVREGVEEAAARRARLPSEAGARKHRSP